MTVFSDAMREALLLTRAGELRDATRVIRDALRQRDTGRPARQDPADARVRTPRAEPGVISPLLKPVLRLPLLPANDSPPAADVSTPHSPGMKGRFIAGMFSNAAGTRAYKLWIPSTATSARTLPLIVMLHGCTQDADDFARGTRMNECAERHGCYVLYPVQDTAANPQRCWRWFDPAHQRRDGGEPSILAGMVRQVAGEHGVDPDRVYVAGLSAGAAMAMVLGDTYPDVFAALAVHSGLPTGIADNVPSAFAAMAGRSKPRAAIKDTGIKCRPVPGLVIHGDADQTVRSGNGAAVATQLIQRYEIDGQALRREVSVEPTHTKSCFFDADGRLVVEQWAIRNGGHAWSGGAAAGSYTDPSGPDASSRIVAFFLTHSQRNRSIH
jgi:poly(hydroxyalkanoate) depolymerase family esterase